MATASETSLTVPPRAFLIRLNSARSRTVISMESMLRPVVVNRQLLEPGSGGWPGSTGLPRTAAASSALSTMPSEPGVTGTPAAVIVVRAAALSPIRSIDSGLGPMNLMPASRHFLANEARSESRP